MVIIYIFVIASPDYYQGEAILMGLLRHYANAPFLAMTGKFFRFARNDSSTRFTRLGQVKGSILFTKNLFQTDNGQERGRAFNKNIFLT